MRLAKLSFRFQSQASGAGSNAVEAVTPADVLQLTVEPARRIRLPQRVLAAHIQAWVETEEGPNHDIGEIRTTEGFTTDRSIIRDTNGGIIILLFGTIELGAL